MGEVGIQEELDLKGIAHCGGPADADKKIELKPGFALHHDEDVRPRCQSYRPLMHAFVKCTLCKVFTAAMQWYGSSLLKPPTGPSEGFVIAERFRSGQTPGHLQTPSQL